MAGALIGLLAVLQIIVVRSPWYITGPENQFGGWLFYVLSGGLINTKAWDYFNPQSPMFVAPAAAPWEFENKEFMIVWGFMLGAMIAKALEGNWRLRWPANRVAQPKIITGFLRKKIFPLIITTVIFLFFVILVSQFPTSSQQVEDDFIVVGGGPPSIALYINGEYVGGVALNDVWPNYTMYNGFLWGDKLVVTIPEVNKWVYIFYIPDFSRPAVVLRTPGNVSHFLYYTPEVTPLEGRLLWLAAFNTTEKRGYLCPLDLESEVLGDCISVGLYPHAPIRLKGGIYIPLIREPYIVIYKEGVVERRLVSARWKPYINAHDPLRFTYFSFHMITTDGSYIYGEGHAIEPGYILSPITVHAHSYLVAMDLQGNVISYYPTSALPPGLPGLAVCRGRLFATSPLESSLYVLSTPDLKPLGILRLGKAPWGVFANKDCSRVYVTDILGGAVYVVNVDTLAVERRIETPMAWPHTVIFVDRGVAEKLRPAVAPRIVYNFTYFPPILACGDLPPPPS